MKNVSLFLSICFRLGNTLALIGDSLSRLNILRPLNVLIFICGTYAFEASASAALSPASQTVNGTVGTAITATTAFTATNFTGDVVYSLDSRLPPGLSLDTDTGVISGTPTEAQSATTYTVTGEDRSGNSATATVSITVAAVPNFTPEITKIESGDQEVYITVSVSSSGDTIITRYEATCSDGTNSFTGISSSSRVTVSGLTNGVTYTCKVRVTNQIGISRVSLISAPVTTEEMVPSGIPIWLLYQASKVKP